MNKEKVIVRTKQDKSEKLAEIKYKIMSWISRYFVLFFVVFVIIEIYRTNQVINLTNTIAEMKETMINFSQSYIAIADNGKLLNLPRNFVKAEDKESRVAEELKLLIVDRATVTLKFTQSVFEKPIDIIENSHNLKKFYFNNILYHRNATEDQKQRESEAIGKMVYYADSLIELIKGIKNEDGTITKELPHVITIVGKPRKIKYETTQNKFDAVFEYDCIVQTYQGKDKFGNEVWKPKDVTNIVKATGEFDIQTQNIGVSKEGYEGANFDGLHIDTFNVVYGI